MGPGRDKHEQYREHVAESLEASPWARVVKVSDFTDNAVGLFHTTGGSLTRRAAKYRPLVPVLRELVLRPDTPLAGDVKDMIAGQLDKAGVRLRRHLRRPMRQARDRHLRFSAPRGASRRNPERSG